MDTLHPTIQDIIKQKFNFGTLTPIQEQVLIKNSTLSNDLLICSPTGSGKSLSYLIPIANELVNSKRTEGTQALIISLTRELSLQLEGVSSNFTRKLPHFVSGALLPGNSRQKEKARLRAGLSLVIGAPGRLIDHLENTSSWKFSNLKWVVIEEADRYLYDKNAKETLTKLLKLIEGKCIRSQWKLVLVSATLPKTIPEIGGISVSSDFVYISLDSVPSTQLSSRLVQWTSVIPTKFRLAALFSLISRWRGSIANSMPLVPISETTFSMRQAAIQSILFVSTCDTVDFLFNLLSKVRKNSKQSIDKPAPVLQINSSDILYSSLLNTTIFRLHGSQTASQRAFVISEFRKFSPQKNSQSHLLVTTSVGARGLDFPELQLVIQWDAPLDLLEYKHKAGRTARFEGRGDAVLFLMPNEEEPILNALNPIGSTDEDRLVPQALVIDLSFNIIEKDEKRSDDKKSECYKWMSIIDNYLYSTFDEKRKKPLPDETCSILDEAKKAFLSSLRAYATYPVQIKRAGVHPKLLHLGHYAKSFGLREAPSELGSLSAIYGGHVTQPGTKAERVASDRRATFKTAAKRPFLNEFAAS